MIVMMFKKELKSLCIGKSLLSLLAMFLMLLAPQAAWAEDPVSYGLTVAGVEYHSISAVPWQNLASAMSATSANAQAWRNIC